MDSGSAFLNLVRVMREWGLDIGSMEGGAVNLDEQLEKIKQDMAADGATPDLLESYFTTRVRKGDAGPRGRAPIPGVTEAICIECRHCRWYNKEAHHWECEATASESVDYRTGIVTPHYGVCQNENSQGKCGHFDRIPMGRFKKLLRRNGSWLHGMICVGSLLIIVSAAFIVSMLTKAF